MINKTRLIKITQKVISFDSCNPPGTEYELAKFIEADMKSLGIDVKTYTYAKNRPNIVATLKGSLPRKEAAREAICITPHFDTVPFGRGWKYPPLSGKIVGNKLYGRGATDDKGNLASCMEVMRSLVESGYKPKKDIVMAATVDEETGSHYGIVPLVKKGIVKPKLALVMDSTEFDAVAAQKGLIHGRVQIFGKKAHGAYNWRGVSAIEASARIINKLKNIKWKYKKHALLRPPTLNIGVIGGGDKVNMVCDLCEFTIDFRFLPGMKAKDILKKFNDVIKTEAKSFKILIDDIQEPYEIDEKHPFIQKYLQVANKGKKRAEVKGSEGATVITLFQNYNVLSFATGWGAHETAHTTDEYIYISSLYEGTKILENYIKEYDLM